MPLEQVRTEIETDPTRLLTLVHGEAGVGKTTFTSQIPGHYHLLAEPAKGTSLYGGPILAWQSRDTADGHGPIGFVEKVEELITAKRTSWKDQREIKVVVFDTYEVIWKLCGEWICKHQTFLVKGTQKSYTKVEDVPWGAGYKAVNNLLLSYIRKLGLLGFGVFMISHTRERTIEWRKQELTTYGPNLTQTSADAIVDACQAVGHFVVEEKVESEGGGPVIVATVRKCFWQPTFLRVAKHHLTGFPESLVVPVPDTSPNGWEVYIQAYNKTLETIQKGSE